MSTPIASTSANHQNCDVVLWLRRGGYGVDYLYSVPPWCRSHQWIGGQESAVSFDGICQVIVNPPPDDHSGKGENLS